MDYQPLRFKLNKQVKNLFLLSGLLVISQSSFAASYWHSSKIKTIYPLGNGGLVLILKKDSLNCPAERNGKYHYVVDGKNGMTQEGIKNVMAVAVLAAATDKSIGINFSGEDANCYINRVQLSF